MATPTIAGAREMLKYLGVTPITKGSMGHKVIITDLREEAVVYIDGTPFVLRELNNPVDTLKHVGITGPVVCHHECLFFFHPKSKPFSRNTFFMFLYSFCRWNTWRHA